MSEKLITPQHEPVNEYLDVYPDIIEEPELNIEFAPKQEQDIPIILHEKAEAEDLQIVFHSKENNNDSLDIVIKDESQEEQDIAVVVGTQKRYERNDSSIDDVPKHLRIDRDWSDTLAQHQEKQAAHIEQQQVKEAEQAKQQAAKDARADQRAIDGARKSEHNENLAENAAIKEQRDIAKNEYLYKQKLQHGEGYMKLFADEMNQAAEEYVDSKYGELDMSQFGYIDTDNLKADSEEKAEERNKNNNLTSEAVAQFYKNFSKEIVEDEPEDATEDDDQKETGPVLFDQDAEDNQATKEKDAIESTQEGIKGRIKRVFKKAQALQHTLLAKSANHINSAKEYLNDEEKGTRRKIVAVAAGAVAVGATYMATKNLGLDLSGGGSTKEHAGNVPTPSLENPAGDLLNPITEVDAPKPPADTAENARQASEITSIDKLEQGGNIWNSAENYLTSHGIEATNENIDRVSDAIREHNNLSEADARQLPVGYDVRIPREEIERLLSSMK